MRRSADGYNYEHTHSGLARLPPEVVHGGRAEEVLAKRQEALDAAYAAHPEPFPRGRPLIGKLPSEVGLDLPRVSSGAAMHATSAAQPATPGSRVSAAQAAP